jgi:ferric-dicitrate binding protein FerR (iron transport regulator)
MSRHKSSYRPGRARSQRSRSPWRRRIALFLALACALAVGTALGVALERGSGAQGTQTREQTVRIVTVPVARP